VWPDKELTMSAISSVGSSQGSLYLQQLQNQRAQNDHDADDGGSSPVGAVQGQGGNAKTGLARFQARFEAAAKSIGVDPAKLPDIEKQIQAAVEKAQQSASGTSGSSDPRSAIRDAVNGVLKSNGIDPAQLDAAVKAQGAQEAKAGGVHRHHGGHRKNTSAASTQSAITAIDITPKDVQPGQTTGTLVDVAA
jgi:hypothetical protein